MTPRRPRRPGVTVLGPEARRADASAAAGPPRLALREPTPVRRLGAEGRGPHWQPGLPLLPVRCTLVPLPLCQWGSESLAVASDVHLSSRESLRNELTVTFSHFRAARPGTPGPSRTGRPTELICECQWATVGTAAAGPRWPGIKGHDPKSRRVLGPIWGCCTFFRMVVSY
jgi:hypothetical protein